LQKKKKNKNREEEEEILTDGVGSEYGKLNE